MGLILALAESRQSYDILQGYANYETQKSI